MGAHRVDDQCAGRSDLGRRSGPFGVHSLDRSLDGVRQHRLLIRSDSGSAPIESLFAVILLLFLVLGTIEVAFALYGRNVIMSSAHEAARAAVELGRDPQEAAELARVTVDRSAGGLARDLHVGVEVVDTGVRVRVSGIVDAFGPIPFPFPVRAVATAAADEAPR